MKIILPCHFHANDALCMCFRDSEKTWDSCNPSWLKRFLNKKLLQTLSLQTYLLSIILNTHEYGKGCSYVIKIGGVQHEVLGFFSHKPLWP